MSRSDELRAVAQRLAEQLPPSVSDVVLTGSTARGVADEHSDIELLVLADDLPEALPLADARSWSPRVEGAQWYGGFAEGEFVELVWWTPAYAEERVRAIAAGEIVDWQRLKTAEAIVNGIPLRGDRAAGWCARLAAWPAGLTEAIVDDAAADWEAPPPRGELRPGDALALAWRVALDGENIVRIVFALNEAWPPSWKRLAQRLAPLARKPDRLADRIDVAVRTLDLAALRTLAAEALALAVPTATVERALAGLAEPL